MAEKMIDNDLCLNCGSLKSGSLDAAAKCPECGHRSGIHQWKCDGCGELIGMTIDDDHQRPEKLLCSRCMGDCVMGRTPVEESVIQEDEVWFSEETVWANESLQDSTIWSSESPQESTVWSNEREDYVWEIEGELWST